MRVYHIFRDGVQQDCCWFRYRQDADKRLREHWRHGKEKVKSDEVESWDVVQPCDVHGGLVFDRCSQCLRKLRIDLTNHLKIQGMKKDFNPNVIDDSDNVRDVFDKETQKNIDEATRHLKNE